MRSRCMSGPRLLMPREISRLGSSPQTLGSERPGGCGAERAATRRDNTIATAIGFVMGICKSIAVGRVNTHRNRNTAEPPMPSESTFSSQPRGRRISPRTTARQTWSTMNLGTATARSRTHSTGARIRETMTQSGCTSKDHIREEPPAPWLPPEGPKALCTLSVRAESAQVELAMPSSMAPTDERLLNSPATVGIRLVLPPGPRCAMMR
mmetsp:Transcript_16201/g.47279  ORF Transcript_16201/g.47279 Transcript_16201/m.47279 type:complete len:209 (+) Transcript_16201:495-1121(+)